MKSERKFVVITGFMCAGKTSVAAALARRLGCEMIDTDELVARRTGRAPGAIIVEDGEASFREAETRALRAALEDVRNEKPLPQSDAQPFIIIALGGGTWTLERNRSLIAAHDGFVVWLDAPFEVCWRRIAEDNKQKAPTRPLAEERKAAARLYEERRAVYALSDLRIEVGNERSADALAETIADALREARGARDGSRDEEMS